MQKAGYEYLLAYKLTVPIYDYTTVFCNRYIDKRSRTHDQMIQASRSGMQNISEGYKQQSLAGYIKLTGVSRGSLEELLKDFLAYARQHAIPVWSSERAKRELPLSPIPPISLLSLITPRWLLISWLPSSTKQIFS